MKKIIVLLLCLLPLLVTAQRAKKTPNAPSSYPRNVIFIVGDGMGTAQVYSSIVAQRDHRSAFLRFPFSGFSRTYSFNRYTTIILPKVPTAPTITPSSSMPSISLARQRAL